MNRTISLAVASLLTLVAGIALAQDDQGQARAEVMESQQFGPYLVDSEGNTLYLFLNEEMLAQEPQRMTEGVRDAAVSCTGECLDAWPAFTSEGEVQASDQLDPQLLYTAEFDGRMQVVYNGWPLYYFVQDDQPGQIAGQGIESFGGEWYIVGPQGQVVREEGEQQPAAAEGEGADGDVAGGGAAEQGQDEGAAEDGAMDGAEDGAQQDGAEEGAQDGAQQDGAEDGAQQDGAQDDAGDGAQDGAAGGGAAGQDDAEGEGAQY